MTDNKKRKASDSTDERKKIKTNTEPDTQNAHHILPDWMLDGCVILREDWGDVAERIALSDSYEDGNKHPAMEGGDCYLTDKAYFDSLCTYTSQSKEATSATFTTRVIELRPSEASNEPQDMTPFCIELVKYFAKAHKADLVSLTVDDVQDLAAKPNLRPIDPSVSAYKSWLFPKPDDQAEKGNDSRSVASFKSVLNAASCKRLRDKRQRRDRGEQLTIIHLITAWKQYSYADQILDKARQTMNKLTNPSQTLVILSPMEQTHQMTSPVIVAPVDSEQTRTLLAADNKRMNRQKSARLIQSMIRYQSPQYPSMALPYGYLPWVTMPDSQLVAAELLDSANIKWLGVCQGFSDDMAVEQFNKAVLQVQRKMRGAQAWADNNHGDRWVKFPKHVRQILREIEGEKESDGMKFRYEKRLLSLIVDPISDEGARSLIVEEGTETRVKQLMNHYSNVKQSSEVSTNRPYGILEGEHAGGMLLYGPPGTGKTQLARVLTQKTNSIVINASQADLRSKWCGQTGLQIKALFNLAKLIASSIIFIDEADGLFKARTAESGTIGKESTGQLLVEMDGLSTSRQTPFVILSTNLPGDLDPAVIRRVPHTTYIGHPSLELREKILDLMLKDELVQGVNSKLLAEWTPNYTGSDIESLCMKAALACDTHVRGGNDEGKRILTRELFARTLDTAGPSTHEKSRFLSRHLLSIMIPRPLSACRRDGRPMTQVMGTEMT